MIDFFLNHLRIEAKTIFRNLGKFLRPSLAYFLI